MITMNWDPWLWRFKQRDPSSTLREADELEFYEQQAVAYNQMIERANKKVGGSVSIGAVVIDSEQFIWDGYSDAIPTAEYWAAVARKNALMWNATRRLYPAVAPSNISWYSRGGVHLRPDLNATACERGRGCDSGAQGVLGDAHGGAPWVSRSVSRGALWRAFIRQPRAGVAPGRWM